MTRALLRTYGKKDAAAFRAMGAPAVVCDVLERHWSGDLQAAFDLADAALSTGSPLSAEYASLLDAERALISVKIGRGLPPPAPGTLATDAGSVIWWYARFSHYFWVDHREAWRSLRRLLLVSLRAPEAGTLLSALFLMGHLLAIAGRSHVGFTLCRYLVARWFEPRPGVWFAPTPFSEGIVFAAFPYTAVVSGQLGRLDSIIARCQRRLPASDPYYSTIFVVSALYAAAYTGNVARAEVLAAQIRTLHERGTLLRYVPIARIMPLLPLALRGYIHLVEAEFAEVVAEHDPTSSDALINSQFYRAAALIALTIGDFGAAREHITRGIANRQRSRSFHAWRALDARILEMATARVPVEPGALHLFGHAPSTESPVFLGTLLLGAIQSLPAAFSDGMRAFEERALVLLRSHLACPAAELRADPASLREAVPQLRVGSRYVVFLDLPGERVQTVERLLPTIAPVLSLIAASIAELLDLKHENERISREAAIAGTVQMLAHDVRRPFGILSIMLDQLKATTTAAQLHRTLDAITPEIERASACVNALVADVMEFGRNAAPRVESVPPPHLIESCLAEAFRIHPAADVALTYRFAHERDVLIDPPRVERVFANIVTNAIEAMQERGRMWFATRDVIEEGNAFVEFVIGNDGPPIPEADRDQVFSVCYTRSKRAGTGLGLAIAEQIVTRHGGRIRCEAGVAGGVEFRFTLPASSERATDAQALASHARQIVEASRQRTRADDDDEPSARPDEMAVVVRDIESAAREWTRALHVMLVDREPRYLDALERQLTGDIRVAHGLRITRATSADAATERVAAGDVPDLIVIDADLDRARGDGLAWVGAHRALCPTMLVCVHGHDGSPAALRAALDVGADRVLPKPMSRAHLLRLVADALGRVSAASVPTSAEPAPAGASRALLPEIAVVDDSRAFLLSWRSLLRGHATAHMFDSPETLLDALDHDPPLLERLAGVITDQRFEASDQTGFGLARVLRERRPCLPVVLSSSAVFHPRELVGLFDGVVDKESPSWSEVASVLQLGADASAGE